MYGVNTNITNKADQPHMSHMSPLQPTMHRKCRGGPSSNWISHIPSHPMLRPGRAFTPMRARSQLPRVTPTELEGAVLCVFMLRKWDTRCKHLPDAQRSGMRQTKGSRGKNRHSLKAIATVRTALVCVDELDTRSRVQFSTSCDQFHTYGTHV